MRTTELTDKQARFIQLRAKGWSYSDIAAELGISKGSCSNWAKRYTAEINRAAAKLKEQEVEPLPKAPKKKVPRVVDITDKLSFDSNPDEPPDFIGRYKRGKLTPVESEGLKQFSSTLGNEMKKAYENYLIKNQIEEMASNLVIKAMEGLERCLEELGRRLEEVGDQPYINEQTKEIVTLESVMASCKPMLEEAVGDLTTYMELLSPEEREKLKSERGQEQAAATRPENKNGSTATALQSLFQKVFATMLSGAITGHLTTINTTIKKPSIDRVTGKATIKLNNGFVLHIENYDRTDREWKPSTIKLLHLCTLLLTESNHYREKHKDAIKAVVAFNINEYMTLLDIPATKSSRKEARLRIKKDLDTLRHSSIDWKEQSRGKEKAYLNTPILGGSYGIDKKGNVIVTFSPQFAEYLIQDAYLMQYSLRLLKVDERNANAYPLGYKLLTHSSIDNNIKRGTAEIISVKKALENCPSIPKYEELQAKNDRHWERKIKEALEKALDLLPGLRWHYCNSKNVPLTEEQLADNSYSSFIGSYIHFEWEDAPDQTKRLQTKAEKARKRKLKNGTKKTEKSKETGEQAEIMQGVEHI